MSGARIRSTIEPERLAAPSWPTEALRRAFASLTQLFVPLAVVAFTACSATDVSAPRQGPVVPAGASLATTSALVGLTITADITRPTTAPSGKYFLLPSGNSTVPYPYGVQLIDGKYYAVAPGIVIASYKYKYYLIPRDAKFSGSTYGYFCGSGWGWNKYGTGNSSKLPIPDGGLDAACLAHDKSWEPATAYNILNGDKRLLSAALYVVPKWQYEADYRSALLTWIQCRVNKQVTTTSWWLSTCAFSAAPVGVLKLATLLS